MMCVFLHNNNSATKANTLDSIKYIAHNSYLSQLRELGITPSEAKYQSGTVASKQHTKTYFQIFLKMC